MIGPTVTDSPFVIYDPSTDLFIAEAGTLEDARSATVDLLGGGYLMLQIFASKTDGTETLLETARWVDGYVEWEATSEICNGTCQS